jgi:methylmalonyl-CoA mutase cobalamin-binding subunit
MGFDRAFPPGTRVDDALAALAADFAGRASNAATTTHAAAP